MLRFSSPGVYAWGNDKENRLLSPINGACKSLLPPSPRRKRLGQRKKLIQIRDTLDSSTSQINCWTRIITEQNYQSLAAVNPGIWIEFNFLIQPADRTTASKTAKPPVTSEMTTEMFRMPLLQLCTRQTVFQRSARRGLRSNCNESTIMSGEKKAP